MWGIDSLSFKYIERVSKNNIFLATVFIFGKLVCITVRGIGELRPFEQGTYKDICDIGFDCHFSGGAVTGNFGSTAQLYIENNYISVVNADRTLDLQTSWNGIVITQIR